MYLLLNLSTNISYASNLKSLSDLLYSLRTFSLTSLVETFLLVIFSNTVNLEFTISSGLNSISLVSTWNKLEIDPNIKGLPKTVNGLSGIQFSKNIDRKFNDILEQATKVEAEKTFSEVQARIRGTR